MDYPEQFNSETFILLTAVLCCTAVFPHNKFLCNIVSGTAVGWFLKLPSILAVSCSRERS